MKGDGSDACLCSTAESKGEAGRQHGLTAVLKEKWILSWFSSGICDVIRYSVLLPIEFNDNKLSSAL